MTMIDEESLRNLLAEAANGFPVSEDAIERIELAASGGSSRAEVVRSMVPRSRWGRVALVAAAVAIVAGGVTVIAGVPGSSPGHRSVAGPSVAAPGNPGAAPSTTLPSGSQTPAGSSSTAAGGGEGFGVNAPAQPNPGQSTSTTSPAPLPSGIVGQSAKVVTTGTIDLALGRDPLEPAVSRLTTIAIGAGGFVAQSAVQVGPSSGPAPASGTMVLQVPQAAFSTVLTQVQAIAKVTSMTSTSTDVTGQYVDLQARIDALQASRQQYLTILTKATSIGDILAVQSQLDTIQSQIEQLQGQLNLLNSQTTYASLTVSLSQSGHRPPPPPTPQSGIGRAWQQSVGGFTSGFEWLVRIAGRTVFVLLCLAVIAFVGKWAWRAWRRQLL
ncbi:MAG: DUF4349 domain-containing protein [Acidimicrobiales bacterium]|jgi:hypothetical protein